MKTRVFVAILLLMVVAILYCSDDPIENAEYQRKTRELKALSERFKAETGFEGTVNNNLQQMRLSNFTGTFKDLDMENVTDSVSTRIVFDNVLIRLLPFIAASKSELIMYEFSSNIRTTDIRYHQIVDGYPIEGSGFINIAYDKNRDLFTILNATVNVQQKPASINLSLKQAMEIIKNYYVRNRD